MDETRALLERVAVVDTVVAFANAFDRQDWARLRGLLTDEVYIDYTDLRSEAPATVQADDYVAARQRGLAGLRTLHLSTNHEVAIEGDRATCRSAYRIYRVDPARPAGVDRFDTAGNYEHGLVRTPDGWRIHSIRQTVVARDGDPRVHGSLQ